MTGPIYLVRHAKAGDRECWTDDDELRPLTKRGRRQSEALVELFDGQPFTRLLSSRYVRCVQTFEPLADARALPIELADGLAEGAPHSASIALVLEAAVDGPVAVSTHGDVILNVLNALTAVGAPPTVPVLLQKGSTWILEVTDGSLSAGRYVPPP